jgi:hypothetical protein
MKKIIIILIVILITFGIVHNRKEKSATEQLSSSEFSQFNDEEYDISFVYPSKWGMVKVEGPTTTCPEEDTYRTQDTLPIYDREYTFSNLILPNSQSFIRSGIRVYKNNAKEICGNTFLQGVMTGIINPEAISSVRLESLYKDSVFKGMYNEQASKLNTEYRSQYTFFNKDKNIIIQSYISYIPVAETKEWNEIEKNYQGNIERFVKESSDAEVVRSYIKSFRELSESIKY